MEEKTASLDSLRREKARLRKIGGIVLMMGWLAAGLVYWLGTRAEDARLTEFEQSRARSESRQLQMLYGRSGNFVSGFYAALKRPGFQAGTIAVLTFLVAAGCFYFGQPLIDDAEPH